MSRGLGKVQRAILDEISKDADRWRFVKDIMVLALHPEHFADDGDPLDNNLPGLWDLTRSEYVSGLRAVESLERRGLVQSKIVPYEWDRNMQGRDIRGNWAYYFGRRCKQVKLCVDPKIGSQHITVD